MATKNLSILGIKDFSEKLNEILVTTYDSAVIYLKWLDHKERRLAHFERPARNS